MGDCGAFFGFGIGSISNLPPAFTAKRDHVVGGSAALGASDYVFAPSFERGLPLRQKGSPLVDPTHIRQAGYGDVVEQLIGDVRRESGSGQPRYTGPTEIMQSP